MDDLEEIAAYIASDRAELARRFLEEIHVVMQRLTELPRMGHRRPDLSDDRIRYWVWLPYVIVYRADVDPIGVLRIVDGRRDLDDLLT